MDFAYMEGHVYPRNFLPARASLTDTSHPFISLIGRTIRPTVTTCPCFCEHFYPELDMTPRLGLALLLLLSTLCGWMLCYEQWGKLSSTGVQYHEHSGALLPFLTPSVQAGKQGLTTPLRARIIGRHPIRAWTSRSS